MGKWWNNQRAIIDLLNWYEKYKNTTKIIKIAKRNYKRFVFRAII